MHHISGERIGPKTWKSKNRGIKKGEKVGNSGQQLIIHGYLSKNFTKKVHLYGAFIKYASKIPLFWVPIEIFLQKEGKGGR